MVPLTDSNGKRVLNDNKQPIITREFTYEVKGQKIIIQDYSEGHKFGEGGIGDQSPHHNVRPEYNTRTGQVDRMEDHYYFEKRNKK
ncbi:type IV secretion protein Rhs [Bacillus thuringiensis serovar medellin]|uniref:Type IV secretion protein Rhs n=1 Tax=Bacillus thuringiensis subsp. medellin TaxID=79672 RepID=A0A9X6R8P2_BACTV|nr:HNH/endonuclease VII fold putative polymorphic toxin [Bacillus thuringiensis]OUB84770.1 type IV secretion protein Rhs [Bacillus thuringiensis serovar medellin]